MVRTVCYELLQVSYYFVLETEKISTLRLACILRPTPSKYIIRGLYFYGVPRMIQCLAYGPSSLN